MKTNQLFLPGKKKRKKETHFLIHFLSQTAGSVEFISQELSSGAASQSVLFFLRFKKKRGGGRRKEADSAALTVVAPDSRSEGRRGS